MALNGFKCFLQWCQLEGQGLVPNEWTYNAKVKVHSSVGDFDAALDTVQEMQANGVMPGRGTWDVIVSMAELMERSDIVQQVALHILHSNVASMPLHSIDLLQSLYAHVVHSTAYHDMRTALHFE